MVLKDGEVGEEGCFDGLDEEKGVGFGWMNDLMSLGWIRCLGELQIEMSV